MSDKEPRLLLCDCTGTMALDADAISAACGMSCSKVHTFLCGDQAAQAATALQSDDDVIIACGQEAPSFLDLAEDLGSSERLTCVDIRDRAGWSDDKNTPPKIAALIADARLPIPSTPSMDVGSEGVCLVIGRSEVALAAAMQLGTALSVTCMVTDPEQADTTTDGQIDIVTGQVSTATGGLGAFSVEADAFATLSPSGRGSREFGPLQNGAKSECDLIVDLTGGRPLFPAHHKRDGYFRADPGDPIAVQKVLFDAAQMTGTFEKPFYIRFDAALCAHSRAEQTGCTRCLDLCPTSAIRPNGEAVEIDPLICAGCGACAAVCPSGAATADDPPVQHLFNRMRVMANAYREAGGGTPRLLVHDDHGAEMIRLAARFGRGLPADVVPIEIPSLSVFGHAEQLAALAVGFASVAILPGPRTERDVLQSQIELATAISGASRPIRILDTEDPEALSGALYSAERRTLWSIPFFRWVAAARLPGLPPRH